MNTIAEKLGLSAEATEADILTALDGLLQKVAAAEMKELETEADEVMNRLGTRVPEAARPQWRAALIANRADAEKLLESSFPAASNTTPIFNRADAKSPAPVASAKCSDEERSVKQNALVAQIRNREKCNFETAWNMARAEAPELF